MWRARLVALPALLISLVGCNVSFSNDKYWGGGFFEITATDDDGTEHTIELPGLSRRDLRREAKHREPEPVGVYLYQNYGGPDNLIHFTEAGALAVFEGLGFEPPAVDGEIDWALHMDGGYIDAYQDGWWFALGTVDEDGDYSGDTESGELASVLEICTELYEVRCEEPQRKRFEAVWELGGTRYVHKSMHVEPWGRGGAGGGGWGGD